MFILFFGAMIVALVWTVYDKLFGKPKPTLEEWKACLEEQEWYQELLANPKYAELIEQHRGIRLFLNDAHELQRLIEKEDARTGFIRYLQKVAGE